MGYLPAYVHKRRLHADLVLIARAALAGATFERATFPWHTRQDIPHVWAAFDGDRSTWGFTRKADAAQAYLDGEY